MNEETRIIRHSIKFDANTMAITFHYLRLNLLCNMFVIEHPELNLPFPIRRNVGMVSGYLGGDKDVLKQSKNENATMLGIKNRESLNKKLEDILKGEDFEEIDIRDINSFKKIYDYFCILELYYDKVNKSRKCESYHPVSTGGLLSIDVTQRYFELVGYWTAKEEQRKNNPGGLAMKYRGEKNKGIIEKILADLDIKCLMSFRTNKSLRNEFYYMAKNLTDCDSEDRISKIARSILNG